MPLSHRIEPIVYRNTRPVARRSRVSSRKVAPKKSKRPLKPKQTKIGLRREWLVPDTTGALRYVGLRGIYWYWLSRQVRKTEWEKYGVCLTCLLPIEDWHYADCGHIIPSDSCGEYLRLNTANLTIQHKHCNNPRITPEASILNALHINQRYGDGYIEMLLSQTKIECKEPTQQEYRDLIYALPSFQEALSLRKDVI